LDTELTSLEILSSEIVTLLLDSECLVGLEVLKIDNADVSVIEYASYLPHLRCLIISGMSSGEAVLRGPQFLSEEVNVTVECNWNRLFAFTLCHPHTLRIPLREVIPGLSAYSPEEHLIAYTAFYSMSRHLCILQIADYLAIDLIIDLIFPALESLTLQHSLLAPIPQREVSFVF
jgi:hypothetical protein